MGGSRDKPFTLRVESDLYLPQGTGSAVCCAEGLLDSAHYRREIHRSVPPMRKRDVKRFPVKNRVLPTGFEPVSEDREASILGHYTTVARGRAKDGSDINVACYVPRNHVTEGFCVTRV